VSTGAIVGLIIGIAVFLLVVILMVAKANATPKLQKVCGGCRRMMLPVWTKCLFCGWAPMASQVLNLSEEVTTIGSVAGNTVVLADPAVSRKHAGIRKVDGNYELADLGSTNGVYVNGHKVPKKTLEVGDIIRVGNTEAVFRRE
jgi:hypothetical protein